MPWSVGLCTLTVRGLQYRCTVCSPCLGVFFWHVSVHTWVRSFSHGCWMGLCAQPSGRRFPFSQAFFLQGGTQVHNCTELEEKRKTFFWNCFWLNCESIRTVNKSWQRVHSWRGCPTIYLCLVHTQTHTRFFFQFPLFIFMSISCPRKKLLSKRTYWLLDQHQCCRNSCITYSICSLVGTWQLFKINITWVGLEY